MVERHLSLACAAQKETGASALCVEGMDHQRTVTIFGEVQNNYP